MQNIKKYFMTLALLLTAVTGAWADESETITTATKGTTVYTGTHFKITASYICDAKGIYLFSNNNHGTATIESLNGENITKIEMHMTCGGKNATKTTTTAGQLVATNSIDSENDISVINVNATSVEIGTTVEALDGTDVQIDKFVIYYGAAAPSGTPVDVAWDKAKKTGTFTMPGGNVTLEPEYYPQAALTAAPTAINDVPATTDGAIVSAGTVANIGETTTAQGTVMYYVSQTALDDDALLALAADAWTADVPTAAHLAQGTAYVYYYVRGNDSDTDAENFSDGDILAANALTVTIAAEPTYAVTFKAANANTIEAGKATVTVGGTAATVTEGKLQGVKMGSEVKVKANNGYKFRSVTVKKRPEFVPGATIQNIESFVEVENNKDGTITLHMPTLKPSTYNVTNSTISNGENTLHFGYEMGSGTSMSSIGANITAKSWNDHTPFSELDKTIDITSGKPRVAILITGHVKSATCPAPGHEHYWGLYRYTNPVKVTYNLGGGSVSGSTADKVEYLFSGDALATTFAAPTREGFTFDGWYTSAEGGTKLTASNATSATTIYAHWNANAE